MLSLRPFRFGLCYGAMLAPEGFHPTLLDDDASLEPFQSDFQAETIVAQLVFGPRFAECLRYQCHDSVLLNNIALFCYLQLVLLHLSMWKNMYRVAYTPHTPAYYKHINTRSL
jgi:hypothetical protein